MSFVIVLFFDSDPIPVKAGCGYRQHNIDADYLHSIANTE
jgi:hypothetical protein